MGKKDEKQKSKFEKGEKKKEMLRCFCIQIKQTHYYDRKIERHQQHEHHEQHELKRLTIFFHSGQKNNLKFKGTFNSKEHRTELSMI